MWVMLLWALTLPGQEKAVYQFLIDAVSGSKVEKVFPGQQGFSEAGGFSDQVVHVFLDAEPSANRTILQQPAKYIPEVIHFSFQPDIQLSSYPGFLNWVDKVPLFLPVSVLPNAP